jgi:hypothetical protein
MRTHFVSTCAPPASTLGLAYANGVKRTAKVGVVSALRGQFFEMVWLNSELAGMHFAKKNVARIEARRARRAEAGKFVNSVSTYDMIDGTPN